MGRGESILNKRRNSIKKWYFDSGLHSQKIVYYSKKEDRSEGEVPGALLISFEGEDTSNPIPTPPPTAGTGFDFLDEDPCVGREVT